MKRFLTLYKKKKDGMINAFIGTIVAIFFLIVVVYLSIEPIEKASIYNQLTDISRAAILRCEADGGLTNTTKQDILDQIKKEGLDPNLATVTCNKQGEDNYRPVTTFGDDVTLTITYKYQHSSYQEIGFNITQGKQQTEIITKTISTTAKN
jgi:hypothetical protein